MMLCMALVCGSLPAYSQALFSKKDAEKDAKKEVKKLTKEKWEYSGVGTFEKALVAYWLSTENYGGKYEGQKVMINNVSSLRKGEMMLLSDAQAAYAQTVQSKLMGSTETAAGEEDILVNATVIKFLADIKGDVKKQIVLYRKNPNGTYDMQGYFLIDTNATEAKLRKLQQDGEISEEIRRRVLGNGE